MLSRMTLILLTIFWPPACSFQDLFHLYFLFKIMISILARSPDSPVSLHQQSTNWSSTWKRTLSSLWNRFRTMISRSSAYLIPKYPLLVNSCSKSLTSRHHYRGEITSLCPTILFRRGSSAKCRLRWEFRIVYMSAYCWVALWFICSLLSRLYSKIKKCAQPHAPDDAQPEAGLNDSAMGPRIRSSSFYSRTGYIPSGPGDLYGLKESMAHLILEGAAICSASKRRSFHRAAVLHFRDWQK